jgi:osmoprotectant transport system substrate-binding protein
VQLEDPAGLFLASNVVPIASDSLSDTAVDIIDAISAALTPEGLIALNRQSVESELPASTFTPSGCLRTTLTDNGMVVSRSGGTFTASH